MRSEGAGGGTTGGVGGGSNNGNNTIAGSTLRDGAGGSTQSGTIRYDTIILKYTKSYYIIM